MVYPKNPTQISILKIYKKSSTFRLKTWYRAFSLIWDDNNLLIKEKWTTTIMDNHLKLSNNGNFFGVPLFIFKQELDFKPPSTTLQTINKVSLWGPNIKLHYKIEHLLIMPRKHLTGAGRQQNHVDTLFTG